MNSVVAFRQAEPGHVPDIDELSDYPIEQAFLGALLVDNSLLARVRGFFHPHYFADALHARIYDAICAKVEAGELASALTLWKMFDGDHALKDIGGGQYLPKLSSAVVTTVGVVDYARHIQDLSLRRAVVEHMAEARDKIFDYTAELPALVAETQGALADALAEVPTPERGLRRPADYTDAVKELFAGTRKPKLSTGWRAIDDLFGIREGELSVVTGYPNAGKSEFIDALCVNLAVAYEWKFAVCSFENPPEEHIAKLAEKYVGQPFWPGRTPRMTDTSLDMAIEWVDRHFTMIRTDEGESPTFDWLLRAADAAVKRDGIKGLVIDPYNEIEHRRGAGQSETDYVSSMLARLLRFTRSRGLHTWFIAHPTKPQRNRDGSVPALSLYDISGSANWNNKADVGVVVNRRPEGNEVDIDVKKVRFKAVGRRGSAALVYDAATGRYSEPIGLPMDDYHDR